MKGTSILIITLLLVSNQTIAHKNAKQCEKWEQQLEKVQTKLRRGYKSAQGNKLRARKRALNELLYKHCK